MINSGFTKKRVGTLTLGEKLRKLRSDRRMSLNEVSRVTKIQIVYLERLEEGMYDKLPADVYVKGFLRSYAEFLGVDEEILVKLYEKEKGIKKNLEKRKNPGSPKLKMETINISSFVFTPKKIALALSFLFVVSAFVYLYKEIGSFASTPRLVVLSPQADTQIDGNSISVEGITDKDDSLFINDQPILVNDDGKFKEMITMQPGVNIINVKSVNKFEKAATETVRVQSKVDPQVAGDMTDNNSSGNSDQQNPNNSNSDNSDNSGNSNPGNTDQLQMEIRVDPGPVWLSVEADDTLVFSGTMLSGATQSFTAHDKIVINSGKANATFLKFNGKDIGALSGDPGAVHGVTFTKDTHY
jgi:cytoskeletal protein RodZ